MWWACAIETFLCELTQTFCCCLFQYVQDFIQQAESMLSEQDEPTSVDSLVPKIPGVCYIRLLKDLHPQVIDGMFSSHENSDLSAIWFGFLQTRMHSHPAGPDLGLFV